MAAKTSSNESVEANSSASNTNRQSSEGPPGRSDGRSNSGGSKTATTTTTSSTSTSAQNSKHTRSLSGHGKASLEEAVHNDSADLFSILGSLHLNNQTSLPQVVSRKRKIFDNGYNGPFGGDGSGKHNFMKPPALRRNSLGDEEAPLQTPQCSQSGINAN